jgi:Flp pilus assembly protein TadG
MLRGLRDALTDFCRREQGVTAVELAIILPIFLLLAFGIMDFGHAWYMKNMVQNASREGARYGTRYQTSSATGARLLPSALDPSIINYTKGLLPSSFNPEVTISGAAATESNVSNLPLEDLTVTVKAKKYWLILDKLVPGWVQGYVNISIPTTMKCE